MFDVVDDTTIHTEWETKGDEGLRGFQFVPILPELSESQQSKSGEFSLERWLPVKAYSGRWDVQDA